MDVQYEKEDVPMKNIISTTNAPAAIGPYSCLLYTSDAADE